jgi:hypothetical protein
VPTPIVVQVGEAWRCQAICAAMLLALAGNLYPVPEGPYGKLPYVYLGYLVAGLVWFFLRAQKRKPAGAEG